MDISASRKPSEVDLDRHSTSAAKRWKHWLKIFENYLENARERMPRRADGAEQPSPVATGGLWWAQPPQTKLQDPQIET